MSRSFNDDYVRIGFVLKPKGIKGELKVQPLTDDVMRYRNLTEGYIEREGKFTPCKITVNRIDPDAVYLYISGVYTMDDAEALRSAYLCVSKENSVKLPKDTWFIKDLEGMDVFCADERLGTLTEVLQTGGVDVYVVQSEEGKRILFPALKRVMALVDVDEKRMVLIPEKLSEVAVYED
ncbi:MAG: 16S rRNA processing protein RimM [Clostridiales bacterium]|nr:16S rRNA processing protein RimM [Clostridiales bacterium]